MSNFSLADDDELLRQCQLGSRAALEELLRRYEGRLYRMAYRVLGNPTLAQEASAEALEKIWLRCGQWRGEASAGTWIYRLAIHTILDARRKHQRWWRRWIGIFTMGVVDEKNRPDVQAEHGEEKQLAEDRLRRALEVVSEQDRIVLHLYYFEERSLAEMEAIMGTARSVLKTRLARARQRLRKLLEAPDEPT